MESLGSNGVSFWHFSISSWTPFESILDWECLLSSWLLADFGGTHVYDLLAVWTAVTLQTAAEVDGGFWRREDI